ncbi:MULTISPECIES: YolD-like family protein [Staphylococcus]|uniref:YolD-like family protein n=2 Tax=Staphylococcus TaxID=1279 RepID=UPI00076B2F72|nr:MULTISPECIES: YolD-like family protein [Staphylococcus]AMG64150.1 YolD-like family protein [Staphylococcus lugdunensis]MCI2814326.1 YolD-like family protein [Staphylococcus lugdunensis]MDU0966817.1 YolD-like family protein [Staphylococcus lugdunensis]MDU2322266.1 YolD-like family protein [Staphylococcus lugdunensis]MDU2406262.1 YolD-like family protein [Staphylococcus lugdunensis]
MIPKQYRHETDYRKIPREYLDSNIPQGRGIVKWAPFATMPEQYQQLRDYIEEQNKIDMPSLSEDQLTLINRNLTTKFVHQQLAIISYWRSGYIHSISGYIKHLDTQQQYIVISNERGNETMNLDFNVLCNVE